MYAATRRIEEAFKRAGLKFQVRDLGKISLVEAGFDGKNRNCTVRAFSSDNDNDVKVLTENFAKIPNSKRQAAYKLLNDLNSKYKYAKFTIDDDGDMTAQYDLPVTTSSEDVGKIVIEIMIRLAKIVDDSYPEIMRLTWF